MTHGNHPQTSRGQRNAGTARHYKKVAVFSEI